MKTEFRFFYKGPAVSATNPDFYLHPKYYTLDEIVKYPMRDLCDLHSFCELVAKSQYTRAVDLGGVRIFHGDVVQHWLGREALIVWNQKAGGFDAEFIRDTSEHAVDFTVGFSFSEWCRAVTVIGNKYQNPELIPEGCNNDS